LLQPDGEQYVLITIEDISSHKEVERLLKAEGERLASEVASAAQELGRNREDLRALTGSLFTSQEQERRLIARELHDDICQRLSALEVVSNAAQQAMGADPAEAQRRLAEVRAGLSALSTDVRRMSHELHPAVIEDLGLAQ